MRATKEARDPVLRRSVVNVLRFRAVRSLLAGVSAAFAYALGGVVRDPGGARWGLGYLPFVGVVSGAVLLSWLSTRRRPFRGAGTHVALVTGGAVAVGVAMAFVPSFLRAPPASAADALYALPLLGLVTVFGLLAAARSIAIGAILFYVADRMLVVRAAPAL